MDFPNIGKPMDLSLATYYYDLPLVYREILYAQVPITIKKGKLNETRQLSGSRTGSLYHRKSRHLTTDDVATARSQERRNFPFVLIANEVPKNHFIRPGVGIDGKSYVNSSSGL